MGLNIFEHYNLPWKYPKNWISNTKSFFRTFKFAYQRCKYGISDYDIWDLDLYLEKLLPYALRRLATKGMGYPGTEEYPTAESWQKALNDCADLLDKEYTNSYEYIWSNINMNIDNDGKATFVNEPSDELTDKFYDEEKRNDASHKINRELALNWIRDNWDSLWD